MYLQNECEHHNPERIPFLHSFSLGGHGRAGVGLRWAKDESTPSKISSVVIFKISLTQDIISHKAYLLSLTLFLNLFLKSFTCSVPLQEIILLSLVKLTNILTIIALIGIV